MAPKRTDKLQIPQIKNYLIDMDGVLVSGNTLIPGADEFLHRLHERGASFLLLTNNSRHTPRDLAFNLQIESRARAGSRPSTAARDR